MSSASSGRNVALASLLARARYSVTRDEAEALTSRWIHRAAHSLEEALSLAAYRLQKISIPTSCSGSPACSGSKRSALSVVRRRYGERESFRTSNELTSTNDGAYSSLCAAQREQQRGPTASPLGLQRHAPGALGGRLRGSLNYHRLHTVASSASTDSGTLLCVCVGVGGGGGVVYSRLCRAD